MKVYPGAGVNSPPLCSTIQSQPNGPQLSGETESKALCNTIIHTPNTVTAQTGRKTRPASTTIDQPIDHNTAAATWWKSKLNSQPRQRTQVTSSTASQRPRVNRNHASSRFVLPRVVDRKAPVPARKMKTGAQK